MNCPNCGAAMELHARRRSFRCAHCSTVRYIDSPETSDGICVVARPAEAQRCPACAAYLSRALLDGRHDVMYCEGCRGILMKRQQFAHVVQVRRAWAAGAPDEPSPLDTRELDRRVVCPGCAAAMQTHPYFGPGSIVIDTCDGCDLIWLDVTELKQITDAPGPDRGRNSHLRRN
jgi:Zn-finger nucleic acid-binding protein